MSCPSDLQIYIYASRGIYAYMDCIYALHYGWSLRCSSSNLHRMIDDSKIMFLLPARLNELATARAKQTCTPLRRQGNLWLQKTSCNIWNFNRHHIYNKSLVPTFRTVRVREVEARTKLRAGWPGFRSALGPHPASCSMCTGLLSSVPRE
jgi:hypothetical protein